MQLSLVHILGIIAIFQSLVLSLFFFTNKKGNNISNKIFGALLFNFVIVVGYSFTSSIDVYKAFLDYGRELFLLDQTAFLIGPLLYLYTKSLLINNYSLNKKELIHIIPFFTAVVLFSILLNHSQQLAGWGTSITNIFNASLLLVELFYIILSYRLLKKNNITIRSFFLPGENRQFSGIRFLVIAFILIWNIKLQSFLLLNLGAKYQFCPYTESLYFLVMFLFLNSLIFITLKNPDFFLNFRKYRSSELSEKDKLEMKEKLLIYLKNEKPYLEPTLTLTLLSEKLSIHSRYLSQIINESFNKNFNDFINEYRIKESEKILTRNRNGKITMLEIAYSSGFNSKSSFYDAFKKHTGLTPTEYKSLATRKIEISLN